MTPDIEVFLVSWAQVKNALLFAPQDSRYVQAIADLEKRLEEEFSVTNLQLVARSYDTYTVAYKANDKPSLLTIDADEVEDFV